MHNQKPVAQEPLLTSMIVQQTTQLPRMPTVLPAPVEKVLWSLLTPQISRNHLYNCWGVRFGIANVQWLETTPKSLSLIIRCWVHTSYRRMTNLFTRKVHLEVEMSPNLRERERHHPNASKYPALCRKRFQESVYSTKFLVSLCLGECAWQNDTMFLFKRSCNT